MQPGFIGAGQMATALASGMSKCNSITEIHVYDPDRQAIDILAKTIQVDHCQAIAHDSNQSVVDSSSHVFIAVKPQYVAAALERLKPSNSGSQIFVSVVAGLTIERLTTILGTSRIVRAMPNTPCLIGEGAIAITPSSSISAEQTEMLKGVFSQLGVVVEVAENLLDAVTGLSGSGPAFVFTFVEAMIDAGVLAGLPRHVARTLAIQTVLGSLKLLEATADHPGILRDRVTSPGGTTIHGLAKLNEHGFSASVMAAVQAAANRAAELSQPSVDRHVV